MLRRLLIAALVAPLLRGGDGAVDLRHTFFSRRGSWMTLDPRGPATLRYYFARLGEEKGNLLDLRFTQGGQPRPLAFTASPARLELRAGGEADPRAVAYIAGEKDVVCDGEGLGLEVTAAPEGPDLATLRPDGDRAWTVAHGAWSLRLEVPRGHARREGTTLRLDPEAGGLRVVLRLHQGAPPAPLAVDPIRDTAEIQRDWEAWLAKLPAVAPERRAMAVRAWWNLWSLQTPREPFFPEGAVLVAKADMNKVWAWDHCFPALALALADPEAGLHQFRLPFLHMLGNGQLPDCILPGDVYAGCTKPPIHGWTLDRILEHHALPSGEAAELYGRLARWTRFWFQVRDLDGNGMPAYGGEHSGWDSGWDNASVLGDKRAQFEAPDLQAYLVLQMRTLSRLAAQLGRTAEARDWEATSRAHLDRLLKEHWNGHQFLVRQVGKGPVTPHSTSLLPLMPLVLGELLPRPVFDALASDLQRRFLTPWGPATETPTSPHYRPDGYWLGPVWAPVTLLLADGLRRGGRPDLARELARRFCDLVEHAGGHWENYDALTGAPLRCKGFAWTSAVDLIFRHTYLR